MPSGEMHVTADFDELEEMSLKALKENSMITAFYEIANFLPIKATGMYYRGLNKSPRIKEALIRNKINIKQTLKKRWFERENTPVTELALFKIVATDEERAAISSKEYIVKEDKSNSAINSNSLEKLGKTEEGRDLLRKLAGLLKDENDRSE